MPTEQLVSQYSTVRVNLQPGVDALGYVKSTTPALLSSTSCLRVVFLPSLVSISPPNVARSIVFPTVAFTLGVLEAEASGSFLGLDMTALTFSATLLTTLFFFAGGAGAGSTALRLRSSTGILTEEWVGDQGGYLLLQPRELAMRSYGGACNRIVSMKVITSDNTRIKYHVPYRSGCDNKRGINSQLNGSKVRFARECGQELTLDYECGTDAPGQELMNQGEIMA